jgi:hypothetical protein
VKLPDSLLQDHFNSSYKRGAVIRYLMPDPDDPSIEDRFKYALLVNLDLQDKESFLFLATSVIVKLEPIRARMPNAFHEFKPGSYTWITKSTLVDLRKPKIYQREFLLKAIQAQTLTFEGQLSNEHLREVDAKLRVSRTIERVTLRKIVAP